MFTINYLAVVCLSFLLLLLGVEIESAPHHHALHVGSANSTSRASSIPGHHHHVTTPDDPTKELVMEQENADHPEAGLSGLAHPLTKRSTETVDAVEKPNTLTIDWKSIKATLSEMIRKLFEFVSATLRKLKDRLLHAFVPFFSPYSTDNQHGHPAVATFTSVDWRSAATTLFNSLNQFQHLRMNEVW